MDVTRVTRWLAAVALVVLVAAELAVVLRPAHADQGAGFQYNVAQPIKVDEASALVPDPVTHLEVRTLPATCFALPTCRLFLLDVHYPPGTDPHQTFFTTISAQLHGSGNYQLELFADPLAGAHEVANNSNTSRTLFIHLLSSPLDPDQEYGITMYLVAGVLTPFTLTISSSTQSFPNPFESLNPTAPPVTIPAPIPTEAPPAAGAPPAFSVPPAVPAPSGAPPPAVAAPDRALSGGFIDTQGFDQGLAAPPQIFKKAAALKPPGRPSSVQLWLALLAFPLGVLSLFPVLIARRRRTEAW